MLKCPFDGPFTALKCPFDGPFTALKCPFQMAPCPFENLGRTLAWPATSHKLQIIHRAFRSTQQRQSTVIQIVTSSSIVLRLILGFLHELLPAMSASIYLSCTTFSYNSYLGLKRVTLPKNTVQRLVNCQRKGIIITNRSVANLVINMRPFKLIFVPAY